MTQNTKKSVTSRIPEFKNRQEMAQWFDTHDLSEYQDEFKTVKGRFELEKSKEKTLVVRIQESLKQKLELEARSKGISTSTLARMWLIEKLQSTHI